MTHHELDNRRIAELERQLAEARTALSDAKDEAAGYWKTIEDLDTLLGAPNDSVSVECLVYDAVVKLMAERDAAQTQCGRAVEALRELHDIVNHAGSWDDTDLVWTITSDIETRMEFATTVTQDVLSAESATEWLREVKREAWDAGYSAGDGDCYLRKGERGKALTPNPYAAGEPQ